MSLKYQYLSDTHVVIFTLSQSIVTIFYETVLTGSQGGTFVFLMNFEVPRGRAT